MSCAERFCKSARSLTLWAYHRTAASQSPHDPEIQYNLAAVLEAVEQLEEALIAYKRALDGGIEVSK